MRGLIAMLESLLQQDFGGLSVEVILINNSPRLRLSKSRWSRVGRLLRQLEDVKIFNSDYNWRCAVRYAVATMAKYETVLFLDDDLILLDCNFVADMHAAHKTLEPTDILSCWNELWVSWDDEHYSEVSLDFATPGIAEITQCDACGPGISMFNRQVAMIPTVLEISMRPEYQKADDMGFAFAAALGADSRCYYYPAHGKLKFHKQWSKGALDTRAGRYADLYALYKSFLRQGYQPVMSRLPEGVDSPEKRAARMLDVTRHDW
jgi:hypothetical protein